MFRVAFLLGLVPGVMFTIALYSKPHAPTAPIIRAQKIEIDDEVWPALPIDAPAITTEAFNHRWGAVNEARYVPRENEVRYIPRDEPGDTGTRECGGRGDRGAGPLAAPAPAETQEDNAR